eukprot:627029-Amphidinium_carterae.1
MATNTVFPIKEASASKAARAKILVEVKALSEVIHRVGLTCYGSLDPDETIEGTEDKMLPFFLALMDQTCRLSRAFLQAALANMKSVSKTVKGTFTETVLICWRRLVKASANQTTGKKSTQSQKLFKEKYDKARAKAAGVLATNHAS